MRRTRRGAPEEAPLSVSVECALQRDAGQTLGRTCRHVGQCKRYSEDHEDQSSCAAHAAIQHCDR